MATNSRFLSNLSNSDTSLWLHNKLGTSHDLWSDTSSIISQLNGDVLRNIRDCFVDLQSQVKLKLLLSFLHISRRNVEQWRTELEEILEVAVEDTDQWVSMLAELLKNYPNNGSINFQLDTNSSSFNDLVIELKKLVRKHGDKGILPLECLYLNKSALTATVGQLAQPVKHFALKRKPKSATLRAELLQKCIEFIPNDTLMTLIALTLIIITANDAANGRRNSTGPSVAIRCRGLNNDSTPLKGIPRNLYGLSQTPGFKTPSNPANKMGANLNSRSRLSVGGVKRDGGIKLLDITEQPLGRDSKRRKKVQNEENDTKHKDVEKSEPEAITPDYAAGLTSTVPPSPAPPSYAPPATPAPQPTVVPNENYSQMPPQMPSSAQPPAQSAPPVQQRFAVNDTYVNQTTDANIGAIKTIVKPIINKTVTTVNTPLPPMVSTPQLVQQLQTNPIPIQVIAQPQSQLQAQLQVQPLVQPMQAMAPQQQLLQQPLPQPQQQALGAVVAPPPQQPLVRRQLQLSREQMVAAQEMFTNSN
ncbi:unnamed protein product, partial [Medioppia subpectinata]